MSEFQRDSKRILLVEDDPLVHSLQQSLEGQLALPVDTARDVDQAVSQLQERGPYALVIIDIMITPGNFPGELMANPLEAGYHLAVKLRAGKLANCRTSREVPIVFYTGVASVSLIDECRTRFGDANVFRKPCEPERIAARIREIIAAKCLIVGPEADPSLGRQLGGITPFEEYHVAKTVDEAVQRLPTIKYAALLVMGRLSADEEERLQDAFPPEKTLMNPSLDPDLPKKLCRFV